MIKLNQISPQISRPDVPHLNFPIPGQMFLMDRFFNGAFLTFGLEVRLKLQSQICISSNYPLEMVIDQS